MPINRISLSKIDTQKLFDCFIDHTNYKSFNGKHGVYCLFHVIKSSYVPLYVGSSIKLKTRATRFFQSQNHYSGNEYVRAILKYLGPKVIRVGIKEPECHSSIELLTWEKIYQEQLNPILNHRIVNERFFNLESAKYFAKLSGLEWRAYLDKHKYFDY